MDHVFFFLILSLRNELLNGGIILLEFMGEEEFVETCLIWKSRVNILLLISCRKFVVDFKFRIWGKIFKLYESCKGGIIGEDIGKNLEEL